MNDNDKEILLYRILSGLTIFYFDSEKYILYSPNKEIRYNASILYNSIINEEKYKEWFREENIGKLMVAIGLWDINTETNIKSMQNQIDELKVELYKNFFNNSKQKRIRSALDSVRRQHNKLQSLKYEFVTHTLEGYANSIKNEFLICNTLYKDNKLVFHYDEIKDNQSYTIFNSLVREIDMLSITTDQFKILAKSNIWKSYWNANKNGTIFDKSISDWTDEQRALLNIARMYDSIYEHPECPDDKVIDDDDALEGWLIFQRRKNDKQKKQKAFDDSNPNLRNASEVFLFPEDDDEFTDIMSLNTDESKAILKEKMQTIASRGAVEDFELPDVQRGLQAQINQLNKR